MTAKRTTSWIALLIIAILVSASACVAIEPEDDTGIGDESTLRADHEQAAALDEALLDAVDEIGQPTSEVEPELEGSSDINSEAVGGKAGEREAEMRWTCTDGGAICCDNTGRCCAWSPDAGWICQP